MLHIQSLRLAILPLLGLTGSMAPLGKVSLDNGFGYAERVELGEVLAAGRVVLTSRLAGRRSFSPACWWWRWSP